ncbi:hypothetical protein T484DRAFT_1802417 [Baffinella frigidus]|nr:hypothetical protein T484DRAFT_1802417 [Cryptophyta sp. CCMP2293]
MHGLPKALAPFRFGGSEAVRSVGEQIRMHGLPKIRVHGLPKALAPFSVVFTGNGAASKGAREIFSLLPHTMVSPEELATLPPDPHRLFGCVVEADHMAARKDGGAFSKAEYYKDPSEYQGIFAQASKL